MLAIMTWLCTPTPPPSRAVNLVIICLVGWWVELAAKFLWILWHHCGLREADYHAIRVVCDGTGHEAS